MMGQFWGDTTHLGGYDGHWIGKFIFGNICKELKGTQDSLYKTQSGIAYFGFFNIWPIEAVKCQLLKSGIEHFKCIHIFNF